MICDLTWTFKKNLLYNSENFSSTITFFFVTTEKLVSSFPVLHSFIQFFNPDSRIGEERDINLINPLHNVGHVLVHIERPL